MSSTSPTSAPIRASRAPSAHTSPRGGVPSAGCCSPNIVSAVRTLPRSGYWSLTARIDDSALSSPKNTTEGNDIVSAVSSRYSPASSRHSAGTGACERKRRSAASTSFAWRATALPMRSVRKPTAVSAATARLTAASNTRTSPERISRPKLRKANTIAFTRQPRCR